MWKDKDFDSYDLHVRKISDQSPLSSFPESPIQWLPLLAHLPVLALQYSCLENPMGGGAWWAAVHGVRKSRTRLSDFTFTFHFHALQKEMAIHSSVLAWRIPRTGKPGGGLPSMGSHRVGHNWSYLAAAAAAVSLAKINLWNCIGQFIYNIAILEGNIQREGMGKAWF